MKKTALCRALRTIGVIGVIWGGSSQFGFSAGDPVLGKKKAALCIACHQPSGPSAVPQWPSLSGQHTRYLIKQLRDYKAGTGRHDAVMAPIVANLSEEDMQDLAAFYAALPLPEGITPQQYVQRGEQLYRRGDPSQHITACIACHGPRGTGNAQAGFPVLAGQQAAYTVKQMQAFKDKERQNDLNSIMRSICARMSQEDMEAVAHYVAGLHE